ncbi:hypothetical protein ACLK19_00805 [Escherichia coli]
MRVFRVQQLRILQQPYAVLVWHNRANAPKALASVDKRGVPVNTISGVCTGNGVVRMINYLAPESAFGLLMALVVSAPGNQMGYD